MSVFRIDRDGDGIVTLLIDMPGPVNVMNKDFTDALAATVESLAADTGVAGVVLASGKDTFFAGGDVKAMAAAPGQGYNELITEAIAQGRRALRGLERLKVPLVAAINGAALGGGYELTLACRHRIAWDDPSVLIGLPEATLGLLPGGGGTVRMVKKFGLHKALPFLLEGTVLQAAAAREAGLVDETVATRAELVPRAKAWIRAHVGDPDAAAQPWDRPGYRVPGGDLSDPAVRGAVYLGSFRLFERTRGLLPNLPLIMDIAVEALKLDIDTALKVETRGLVTAILSPQAKNLMSANFTQKNAVRRGVSRPAGVERSRVQRLALVGSGTAAASLAAAARSAGITALPVPQAAPEGVPPCELVLVAAEAGPHAPVCAAAGAAPPAWAVVGAPVVAEEAAAGALAAWASAHPESGRVVGLRLPALQRGTEVVEIVRGEPTSDETLARAFDFVRQIGAMPIVVADRPGGFADRVAASLLREAAQLVAEGVHPVRVDNLARAIGLAPGPLARTDMLGAAWLQRLAGTGHPTAGQADPRPGATALLARLLAGGRAGRGAGGGFFDDGDEGAPWAALVDGAAAPPRPVADADVEDRLLFAAVIESLDCLDEGVVRTVAEANIGALLGAGAPGWTGGYVQFVNTYGLQRFAARCDELAAAWGPRFRVPAGVAARQAATGVFA